MTIARLASFFTGRGITVESLLLQKLAEGEATIWIRCFIERDRIRHTRNLLEKIEGILQLELFESRGFTFIKIYKESST